MRPPALGELLEVEPPAAWVLEKRASDWIVIPASELETLRDLPECVRRSLWIGPVPTGNETTQERAIEAVMRPRLGSGQAELLSGQVDGRDAVVLGWTDGVADVISFFVDAPTGELLELQVALNEPRAPDGPTTAELASLLLPGVRWRPLP